MLLIDGDPGAGKALQADFATAGFELCQARSATAGLRQARRRLPEVVLLDSALPDGDGLALCVELRSGAFLRRPRVVLLSSRAGEADRILGLEAGADDYVVKPFNTRELILRIRNLLPEPSEEGWPADTLRFGELCIDVPRHAVTVGGRPAPLTLSEFRLLTFLAQHRGEVYSRERLMHELSDGERGDKSRTIDTHMRRLRSKLGSSSRVIGTVYGLGYRFVEKAG